MKRRMSHWPVALQNSGYGACKATNMLWTALDADQWRIQLIQRLIRPFFCLPVAISYQPLTTKE